MTVAELIDKLKSFPPGMTVVMESYSEGNSCRNLDEVNLFLRHINDPDRLLDPEWTAFQASKPVCVLSPF